MRLGIVTPGAVMSAPLYEYGEAHTWPVCDTLGNNPGQSYIHSSLHKESPIPEEQASMGDFTITAGRGGLPDAESDCLNRGLCPIQIGQGNTERDIPRGRRSTAKYKTASGSGNSEPVWRA